MFACICVADEVLLGFIWAIWYAPILPTAPKSLPAGIFNCGVDTCLTFGTLWAIFPFENADETVACTCRCGTGGFGGKSGKPPPIWIIPSVSAGWEGGVLAATVAAATAAGSLSVCFCFPPLLILSAGGSSAITCSETTMEKPS